MCWSTSDPRCRAQILTSINAETKRYKYSPLHCVAMSSKPVSRNSRLPSQPVLIATHILHPLPKHIHEQDAAIIANLLLRQGALCDKYVFSIFHQHQRLLFFSNIFCWPLALLFLCLPQTRYQRQHSAHVRLPAWNQSRLGGAAPEMRRQCLGPGSQPRFRHAHGSPQWQPTHRGAAGSGRRLLPRRNRQECASTAAAPGRQARSEMGSPKEMSFC